MCLTLVSALFVLLAEAPPAGSAATGPEPFFRPLTPAVAKAAPETRERPTLFLNAGYGVPVVEDREPLGLGMLSSGVVYPLNVRWELVGEVSSHPRWMSWSSARDPVIVPGIPSPWRLERGLAACALGLRYRWGDQRLYHTAVRLELSPVLFHGQWTAVDAASGRQVEAMNRVFFGFQAGFVVPARINRDFVVDFGCRYVHSAKPGLDAIPIDFRGLRLMQLSVGTGFIL